MSELRWNAAAKPLPYAAVTGAVFFPWQVVPATRGRVPGGQHPPCQHLDRWQIRVSARAHVYSWSARRTAVRSNYRAPKGRPVKCLRLEHPDGPRKPPLPGAGADGPMGQALVRFARCCCRQPTKFMPSASFLQTYNPVCRHGFLSASIEGRFPAQVPAIWSTYAKSEKKSINMGPDLHCVMEDKS